MECRDCNATLPAEARFCLQCGARVQAAPDPVADPLREALERAIGFQYRVERLLGRGGMGAVYLAHELALDRDVAIKVLPPEQGGTPEMRARFKHEARTAARLTHPNIVPLHTFGEVDGLLYFVMGYVAGDSLAARLRRDGPLSPDATRALLTDLTGALEYAHRLGIVHRDLKPDNILIDADSDAPLLTDFGIAKAPVAGAQLTMTGQIVGTPHYMSPEQARGLSDIDARSDLYSLGVMAYEMLSGRPPFDAESPLEALTRRLTQNPPPLMSVAPGVDADLADTVMRCLEREPANRWPDARELRAALTMLDEGEDPLPIRLLKFAVTLAVATSIAVVYLMIFKGPVAGIRAAIGMGTTVAIMGTGAFVVARRQKLTARAIGRLALMQPRWWRFWYPKPLRRHGDVWDRLPRAVRRLRIQTTVVFGLMFGIAIPTQLGLLLTGGSSTATTALTFFMLACMTFMFVSRSRMTRYVSATLGMSTIEASRILSLKSWQTTAWQSGSASTLLRWEAPGKTPRASPDAVPTTDAATTAVEPVDVSNEVTRL
ncbi:MAG TPA: serine/threonine-protein kinase [Vicinamibacterales bacterium]